jgi:hypothetical protein
VSQLALAPRPTSALCLAQIRREGLLGAMQLAAYEALLERGPLTGRELDEHLSGHGGRGHGHKRLPELARVGLAVARLTRLCRVTGRVAIAWEAVDALPRAVPPKPTRVEAFAAALAERFEDSQVTWTGPEVAHLIRRVARGEG